MSQKDKPQKAVNQQRDDKKRSLSRRSFLKATAAGAGALALSTASRLDMANAASQGKGEFSHGDRLERGANSETPPDYRKQADTWVEPWEWVQRDWPGQQLQLNVVGHAAPIALFGNVEKAADANVGQFLFSYNGISPGPTIRVRGDDVLHIKVRNLLGPNDAVIEIPTGEEPPAEGKAPTTSIHDYCRPVHSNGPHQAHTTNLHTHGLHVQPYLNPDGKNSDNVFLRIVPQEDFG